MAGKQENIPPSQHIAKLRTIKYPAKLPFKYPITPVHIILSNATNINTFLNPILSINNAHPALEQPLDTD